MRMIGTGSRKCSIVPIQTDEMMFRTENSLYEVRRDQHLFRRLTRDGTGRIVPQTDWQPFEAIGAVALGERVRFFLPVAAAAERALTWTTTTVRELLAAV